MSMRRLYTCDLCGSSITDKDGIAIRHGLKGEITAEYLAKDGCGHHLCNTCVKGLRGMLAGLDRFAATHADLDAMERSA